MMKQIHINYFCRVAENHSVTIVAKQLGVSQPAVSYAIKEFESDLGLKLFIREKKKLILTPDGKKIYSFLKPAIDEVSKAERKMLNYAKSKATLRIATPSGIGSQTLTSCVAGFQKTNPSAKTIAMEMDFEQAHAAILNGDVDVAVQIYPKLFNDAGLVRNDFAEPQLMFAVAKGHPLEDAQSLRFEDIAHTPIALTAENSLIYQTVLDEFDRQGVTPNVILSTPQISTIMELVDHGSAGTFLYPDEKLVRDSRIRLIPIRPELRFVAGVFYAQGVELSKTAQNVIQYVKKKMLEFR